MDGRNRVENGGASGDAGAVTIRVCTQCRRLEGHPPQGVCVGALSCDLRTVDGAFYLQIRAWEGMQRLGPFERLSLWMLLHPNRVEA